MVNRAPGPALIGHIDWRPANVRFGPEGDLVAVYDWDSIQLTHRVHILAGACSGLSPEKMIDFLCAYQNHDGHRLTQDELLGVAGRVVWSHAMWARFELSRGLPVEEQRFVNRLKADAAAYPLAVDQA